MSLSVDISVTRGDFTLQLQHAFPEGQVTAVVGPNGAGKSTLIEVIAGIIPAKGHLDFAGRDLGALPAAERGAALLKQSPLLFPHLSVKENVEFGARAQKYDVAEAFDWAQRLDLIPLMDRMPNQLSGGQAARVALARALASRPRLLLLDEPAAAMDVAVARKFRHLLATELKEHPITTVLVSHTVEDVIALADQVLVLEHGQKTAYAQMPSALVEPPCAFLAEFAGVNRLPGVVRNGVAESDGVPITSTALRGSVWVAFPPGAAWLAAAGQPATVSRIDADPSGYRVTLSRPAGLVFHVPLDDPQVQNLRPGNAVQVRIDEGKVRVYEK